MDDNAISFARLSFGLIPVVLVVAIMVSWSMKFVESTVALTRMVIQLLLIGIILHYIFGADNSGIVIVVCLVMVTAAAWIALRTVPRSAESYSYAFVAILIGGGVPLLLTTQFVLQIDPWYSPRSLIPLAGMVFANGMNAVSLAAERFQTEMERIAEPTLEWRSARNTAFKTALIPITNGLLSVGLVSIPGFMTGQILNGTSPAVAARAQIMIMCMVYGAVGLSTIGYLALSTRTMWHHPKRV